MRRQQADRGEMQPTLGQGVEDGGQPPCRSGRLDTFVGGVLGEAQFPDTKGVYRWESSQEVEPALVDLGQVGQDLGGGAAFLCDD